MFRFIAIPCTAIIIACAALLSGCKSAGQAFQPKPRPAIASPAHPIPADPIDKTGGCDSRLQDISGLFLLYSLRNHRLPQSVDELRNMPGATEVPILVCPVSKLRYVYIPKGIPVPSGAGKVILYDATPVHDGMRLCIVINETGTGGALVTKVIALPERFFQTR